MHLHLLLNVPFVSIKFDWVPVFIVPVLFGRDENK